jgi:ribonuclease D
MQDGVVAIDLEWRPDYRPGSNNRVALMQLASGSTCVLIRCCLLGYSFPAALQHLFSDPSLTFVSFSWDSSDEMKMKSTFGVGKDCFARFLDLQQVANTLGYPSIGLAALTARVLGVTLPKSRSVSRSDWQRAKLTPAQVQYAALDALVTGCVFRGLRLWHASPSPCTVCKQPFGVEVRNKKKRKDFFF